MLPVMHRRDVVAFRPGSRSEWKAMFEVAQLAIYQRELGFITEHRHGNASSTPVDVEPRGIRRISADSQDVPPCRVLDGMGNTEMVRNDVDDRAKTGQPSTRQQPFQSCLPAAIMINPGNVCRVVPMIRTDRRLQHR